MRSTLIGRETGIMRNVLYCKMPKAVKLKISEKQEGKYLIEIYNKTANKFFLFFTVLLSVLGFLAPIVAILLRPYEIKATIVISIIILWGVSYYLLKMFLWNLYGKEVILIDEKNVECYLDLKYFKLNNKKIVLKNMEFIFLDSYKMPVSLNSRQLPTDLFLFIKIGDITTHSTIPLSEIKTFSNFWNKK
jgi:hypothetical protein